VQVHHGTKADYLHSLHRVLLEAYDKNENVVLIIDEAQGLDPKLLEEIRLLSNFETSRAKLLQIILVGQPELNKTLMQPEFRQLRQRINMRYHLLPLSSRETKAYIERRLTVAGAQSVFTEAALREIYLRTKGIPRLVNILCDNSLLNGYAFEERVVHQKLVKDAAADLNLRWRCPGFWLWAVIALCAAGAVLSADQLSQTGSVLAGLEWMPDIARRGIESLLAF